MKPSFRSLYVTVPVILVLLSVAGISRASIVGFQDFSNFTINVGDSGASPTVTIASGIGSSINLINSHAEDRSIFCDTPQSTSPFTASFTFQGAGGNPDGTCFVIQNSSSGASALGFSDGYSGIGNSAAVALELDNVGDTNTGLYTNGNTGGSTSSSPISLFSNDPINVSLSYNGSVLSETLTDATTSATFSTSYLLNLPSVIGGSSAFVGFAASSNFGSSQTISNFQFNSVPEPASLGLLAAGAVGALLRRRR